MMKKECFKCHQVKDLSEFYRHDRMADGHLNKCKACTRVDVRINAAVHDVKRLEYEHRRSRNGDRRRARAVRNKRYRFEHPEREAAYRAIYRAVRAGRVTKPTSCQGCGKNSEVHAHHQDYQQPLNIVWLCARCHAVHHHVRSFFGEGT